MLTQPLLSHQLNTQELLLRMQPALDMVLAAIHRGQHFLETCRPSPTNSARSYSGRGKASSSSLGSIDEEDISASSERNVPTSYDGSWLHRALLQGCATDAIDIHLHDFLIAFSAAVAAIEKLHIPYGMTQRSADQEPSPDLFWREQNKPHVLLVSAKQLDHVKHHDETFLNSQLEMVMNLGCPDSVSTKAADEGAQLAANFVKEKIKCARQAIHESIDPASFLEIRKMEVGDRISTSSVPINTSVHEVRWLGRKFALKFYKADCEQVFLREAKIHFRLHHPNVVHAVALCKEHKESGILMERMHEDLKTFMAQRSRFSLRLQEKVSIMLQIAKGMAYVHERGVIHRDLKPSNLLVRTSSMDTEASTIQQLEVKVADFGVSNLKRSPDSSSFRTKKVGTSVYRAPEVLNDNQESSNFTSSYKRSADVYSFAMTCFELLAEEEPFHESLERGQAMRTTVIGGERPNLASINDAACPPYLKHCLETWWADDPETRHSFKHISCILRHMYACLASCQINTQPIVQFSFLAWPFWRWRYAQEIAQQKLQEFEKRRANDDWKDKGNLCESTRVHEIPYEMHVMRWAIKKAEETASESVESFIMSARPSATGNTTSTSQENCMAPSANEQTRRATSQENSMAPSANEQTSGAPARKSFKQNLKEFCCFSANVLPSNHEAFHYDISRRN